jgi:hypothetical protein
LTFEFPNNVRGPPVYTYDKEPNNESSFLGNVNIKKFVFGLNEPKSPIFFLNSLKVFNDKGELACELKGSEQQPHRVHELVLKESESVVGVRI